MNGQNVPNVVRYRRVMMEMNKVQVDAEWLERVTVDVSEVTAAVREIADQARALKTLLDDARTRELSVRLVHSQWKTSLGVCCSECRDLGGSLVSWPCDTISALGVESE
jgi:hypothetical protein